MAVFHSGTHPTPRRYSVFSREGFRSNSIPLTIATSFGIPRSIKYFSSVYLDARAASWKVGLCLHIRRLGNVRSSPLNQSRHQSAYFPSRLIANASGLFPFEPVRRLEATRHWPLTSLPSRKKWRHSSCERRLVLRLLL